MGRTATRSTACPCGSDESQQNVAHLKFRKLTQNEKVGLFLALAAANSFT